ncbi:iron complex outermembrane receptor protein [Sphingomonas kaistensis]|uniref:Iron complex outermembrane receptor protein n=1 Tax=Sphingomonas kaistensis TaxID=298708 RepID=A0A7X6BFV8_9SPHN|nr:TonB-dependent receptor [Sphingomonas kaistensis]NJC04416.1 iron complex outermembrane receptor protein [Sphingomonas kaistensis]
MGSFRLVVLSATVSPLALLLAAPASAQAGPVPSSTETAQETTEAQVAETGVEDIVVTAQRRTQRLQDAPVSVTALSNVALEARGIDNLGDVSNFAPNLELHPTNRPAGGGSAFAGYIRGVGTGDFQFPTDPGIGVYVDDVYIARSVGGLLSLEDVERVEVLKGPQGTLYGRNTIGGAINVITTEPRLTGDFSGLVKARAGSYGRFDLTGLVNTPLIEDRLGLKLSVSRLDSAGYGRRLLDNQRYASEGRVILRGAIKARVNDAIDVKVAGDYTRQRQKPPSGYLIDFVPTGATVAKIARFNTIAAPFVNGQLGLPAGSIYDARWEAPDPYRVYALQPQQDDSDIGGVSGVVNVRLSDTVTFRSISAWRTIDALIEVDGDQVPYVLQQSRTALKQNQYSQEFQLGGTALGDRLNFLVGAYAFREKGDSSVFTRSFEGIYEALIAAGQTPIAADAGNTFTTFGLEATSYALFTQNTLKLTDQLGVTVGARINRDKKDYSTSVRRPQNGQIVVPFSTASAKWNSFTPRLALEFKPNRDLLFYTSYSKGFKSGGFGASTVASPPTPRYEPEKLTSYEAGAKTSWFDNRLTFNIAGFYSKYRNIQLTVQSVDPVTNANIRTTRNAGGSNIKGFEAELVARPLAGLDLNLGVGHVDAKLDTLSASALSSGFRLGDRVPQIPNWSVNAGASYRVRTGAGDLTLRGDLSHKGSQFLTAADPTSFQEKYTLLGARVSFEPSFIEGLELSVEGTNLTDKRYNYYKGTLAPTGEYVAIPAAPREIYATARFRI